MSDARPTPTSHTYFSQRLRLHYLDWGNESAPLMVLLHGSQDHCHSWDWLAEQFCDDWHVIAPDLRGHGDSEWSRGSTYSAIEYIYDLAQLIHQKGLDPVTLVSHSMGGSLALRYAGIYPEKIAKVVALEAVGTFWDWRRMNESLHQGLRDWIENTRNQAGRLPRRYPNLEDAFERMHQQNSHLSEEQARHLTVHGSSQNEDGSYSWKFDNYTRTWTPFDISGEETARLWERITAPVLLINAKQGYPYRAGQEGSDRHFQHATILDVDDAGHWVHHDQPEIVANAIRDFVSR